MLHKENIGWTVEQEKAVQRVLNVPSDSNYEVLGLQLGESHKVEAAGDKLLRAIDPGVNNHPDAAEALENK